MQELLKFFERYGVIDCIFDLQNSIWFIRIFDTTPLLSCQLESDEIVSSIKYFDGKNLTYFAI